MSSSASVWNIFLWGKKKKLKKPQSFKYCLHQRNGTNTTPVRHSTERAFHQIWFVLLRKIRYKIRFSSYRANTPGSEDPSLSSRSPSNASLEAWKGSKGATARPLARSPPSRPTPQSPPRLVGYVRPRNSNASSRETENTNGADPSGAGASQLTAPNTLSPERPRASWRGLPRPCPTRRRVSGVSPIRRHSTEARGRPGAAQGPKRWLGEVAGLLTLLLAPRPLQRGPLLGLRPPLQLDRGRGLARPCCLPRRVRYLVWGCGQGGRKGSGRRQLRQKGKISAATARRLRLKQNLVGDEGEGKKTGHGKEEKTEAGEISRNVESLARRRLSHAIPSVLWAAQPY